MIEVPRIGGTLQFLAAWMVPWRSTFQVRSAQSKLSFFVHRRDAIGRHIAKYGTHEPLLTRWLAEYLAVARPGLFIDVGANLGWHTPHAARGRMVERVVAFEPDLFNASLLERNCAINGADNVVISTSAVGAQPGLARLHRYKSSNGGRHSMAADLGYGSKLVPVCDLDGALAALGLSDRPVTALKIDVEGYEPAVIAGASRTLSLADAVIMEYSPDMSQRANLSIGSMLTGLNDAGFAPFALRTTGDIARIDLGKLRTFEGQVDVVWLRTEPLAGEIASLMDRAADVHNLLELAEANKVVVKPV